MKKQLIIKGEVVEMSFEEVLELFTPIIHNRINAYKMKMDRIEEERADMFQESSIQLWYAFKNYDVEKGYYFTTWAQRYLQKGVHALSIKNNAQKRDGFTISIDQNLSSSDEKFNLSNVLSENPDLSSPMIAREILSETIKELTDLEAEYLLKMMCGYNATDVANEKGVTRQTAKEKFDKIKKKIEKISIEYGYLN